MRTAGGLLAGTLLFLMPKCPLCLAAYVTMATGVSLSATTAGHLRAGLIAASVCVLLALSLGRKQRTRWKARLERFFRRGAAISRG